MYLCLKCKISVIEDKFSSVPDKVTKELDEASKFKDHCDDPKNCEYCKKKWILFHAIYALAYFIIG